MAFSTKFFPLFVMAVVLLFLVLIQQQPPSDIGAGHGHIFGEGASHKIWNRKVAVAMERKELRKMSGGNDGEKVVEWELRKVPSGPDPLHHNGGSPKKPRTP